jgi:hypothetical protein
MIAIYCPANTLLETRQNWLSKNNLPNDSQFNKTHNTFESYQTYVDKTVMCNNQLISIVSLVQFALGSLH